MQMIEVSKLKSHPRNQEFFDDIEGEKWKDFVQSIIRRGVVEAIVVTQDLVIVSGHQRVRASRKIGILEVPCRITHYPDYDKRLHITKEDMILEDLICTNIMQRGVGNVNAMKMGKCIIELERIYGIRHGGDRGNQYTKNEEMANGHNVDMAKTQSDLAEQLNLSQKQLERYKKLTELIPELQSLVEIGDLKATTAYKIYAKLPQEEQEELFKKIGIKKIKTLTQKQTEEEVGKLNKEKEELKEENNKIKQLLEKEKSKVPEIVQVDNTDYTVVDKNKELEKKIIKLTNEKNELEIDLDLMTKKADAFEQDSLDYKKMKEDITYLTKQKDDLGRQIQAITDISGLVIEIDDLIKSKLAPVRYSRSLLEAKNDEIVMRNLTEIVDVIEGWCYEMKQYIPNKINYVEVV